MDELENLVFNLNGFQIVENSFLTVKSFEDFRRSWFDRIFSFPWEPFRVYDRVIVEQPDMKLYRIGNKIIGSPAAIQEMCRTLEQKTKELSNV